MMIKKNFKEIQKELRKKGKIIAMYQEIKVYDEIFFIVRNKEKIEFYRWDGFAKNWNEKFSFREFKEKL